MTGANPGIFDKGVQTLLSMLKLFHGSANTSTPRQFSVIVHHIPQLQFLWSFDFNWLKEQVFLQTPGTAQCE